MKLEMRNIILPCLLAIAALSTYAATPSRYELDVKDFNELKVIEGINVDYACSADSAGKAVFTATPELASVIMFTNNNGKLEMQISTEGIDYHNLPTVKVYSNFLTKIENSGDSTVRVLSLAAGPKFKARLIGNGRLVIKDIHATNVEAALATGKGNLIISGDCTRAKLSMTGTGTVEADNLKVAEDTRCILAGTGSIGCYPVNKLKVLGAASGKVYYRGKPKSIDNLSIGIKIESIE